MRKHQFYCTLGACWDDYKNPIQCSFPMKKYAKYDE